MFCLIRKIDDRMQYSLRKLVYFRKYIVRHFCFSSILLPLNFVDQLIVFPFLKVLSCIIILISDSSSNVMDVSCAMIGRYLALVLLPLLNKWMRRFHKQTVLLVQMTVYLSETYWMPRV